MTCVASHMHCVAQKYGTLDQALLDLSRPGVFPSGLPALPLHAASSNPVPVRARPRANPELVHLRRKPQWRMLRMQSHERSRDTADRLVLGQLHRAWRAHAQHA